MNDEHFAAKVGFFVFVTACLGALLIISFTKGITAFESTYELRVIFPNAAGLKPTADVMMAGVVIGKVTDMKLEDNGKYVDISVKILDRYQIRDKSKFYIDSLGFLGDQYISVVSPESTEKGGGGAVTYYKSGETIQGVPTFNMDEAVKSISGVVDAARKTMMDLDQAITNVNNSALAPATLTRFSTAVSNLEYVSAKAGVAASRAADLLGTNSAAITDAVSNFMALSASLTNTAGELNGIVLTNRGDVRAFVTNMVDASANVKKITSDAQNGNGPIHRLLSDEKMSADLASLASNAGAVSAQLSIFSSNLNQKGIWAMLWKPKHPETHGPEEKKRRETNGPPDERWKNRWHN